MYKISLSVYGNGNGVKNLSVVKTLCGCFSLIASLLSLFYTATDLESTYYRETLNTYV